MFAIKSVELSRSHTELLYLINPLLLNHTAVVVDIRQLGDGWIGVVTDSSPFYVKGGGQKSDIGTIKCENIGFRVFDVRHDNGTVFHVGRFDNEPFEIGNRVDMQVDPSQRELHTQLHTAGELICAAMKKIGYDWKVVGAIHYPDRCAVEYGTIISPEEGASLRSALQQEINTMIQTGSAVTIHTYTEPDRVIAACGFFPDYVASDEAIRVVTVWNGIVGRPCMGTHVANINQLWPIDISGVKCKKGVTTIKYNMSANLRFGVENTEK